MTNKLMSELFFSLFDFIGSFFLSWFIITKRCRDWEIGVKYGELGWPRIVMQLMWARLIIDLSKSSNSGVFAQNGTAQDAFHLAGVEAKQLKKARYLVNSTHWKFIP